MTFTPRCRIAPAAAPPALRLRGIALPLIAWPDATLGSGADYSVDFSGVLCGGDTIVQVDFGVGSNGTIAWTYAANGIATAWITWAASGALTVPVAVLTSSGATLQVSVSISISSTQSLITPAPPPAPDGSDIVGGFVSEAVATAWMAGLPTSPPTGGGWWSNNGIPEYDKAST